MSTVIDPREHLLRAQAPLQPGDRVDRTVGCRQSQPSCCGRNSLPTVCAFAREDEMCLAPPTSWKKRFAELSAEQAKAPISAGGLGAEQAKAPE